jgi:hypothetical protein
MGLSTAGLPIDKDSTIVAVEDIIEKGSGREYVHLLLGFIGVEEMVEGKVIRFKAQGLKIILREDNVFHEWVVWVSYLSASESKCHLNATLLDSLFFWRTH